MASNNGHQNPSRKQSEFKLIHCTLNVKGLNNQNKRRQIFQYCRLKKFDVIFLQETFITKNIIKIVEKDWNGISIHALTDSSHSRGVSILFKKSINPEILTTHHSSDGRLLFVNVKIKNEHFSLLNMYAPNNPSERKHFFKKSEKWLHDNSADINYMICSGDLNCVDSKQDRTSQTIDVNAESFSKFKSVLNLNDVWRMKHPLKSQYTWTNPGDLTQQSRIDYTLVPAMMYNLVESCEIQIAPTPDHAAVVTIFSNLGRKRGSSYWKLNTSVLNDNDYIIGIEQIYDNTLNEYMEILPRPKIWDMFKIRVKEFSIRFCSYSANLKKKEIESIEKQVAKLEMDIAGNSANASTNNERTRLRSKLKEYYDSKSKGYYIRSRAKWAEEGESSTAYFLGLERRRQTYNRIDTLQNSNGNLLTNDPEILKECVSFYRELYTSKNPDLENITSYIENTDIPRQLTVDEKELCEGHIQEAECEYTVKCLKKNSSPGIDGLPGEFYQKFWYLFGKFLTDVFNDCFISGELTNSQKTAVISLIHKKNERSDIKNYRPITLSTVDYKILAFILASRMQKVISSVISTDQTAFIRKRFIGHNIRIVEDIIEYCEKLKARGVLVFLDFEKAFDSIEKEFIIQALKAFGFGEQFITWFKVLYKDSTSMIKNNGWISEHFPVERGIKQGCPISALLFILSVEILALSIKQNRNIKGIDISSGQTSTQLKIKQFADDAILFLKNCGFIAESFKEINKFSKVSGLKLNLPKTVGLKLGIENQFPYINTFGIQWPNHPIRCLGIYVGNDKIACKKLNWDDKILDMQKLLDNWRKRDLTFFGKITITKTLALSKIIYSEMNTSIPEECLEKINKLIFNFLWNGKDRIKRNTMIGPLQQGGMDVPDIHSFFTSIKASWVHRFINGKNESWSAIANCYLQKVGNDIAFKMSYTNQKSFPLIEELPVFYRQVLLSYNQSKPWIDNSELDRKSSLNQIIWGNRLFNTMSTKNKKHPITLYYKNWIDEGIIYLRDLKIHNGKLDICYILQKVKKKQNIYQEIYILQNSLHTMIRLIDFNNPTETDNEQTESNIETQMSSRKYYSTLIERKFEKPTLIKWFQILATPNSDDIVLRAFFTKVVSIRNKKIAAFNFKVLHYILATSSLVSKWNINVHPDCEICHVKDNIQHLIYQCQLAQYVWTKIGNYLNKYILLRDVVLGVDDHELNYIYSFVAFTIYKMWCIENNNNPRNRTRIKLIQLLKNDICMEIQTLKYQNINNSLKNHFEKILLYL